MRKDYFTDEQVEAEIERLTNSEAVKLARQEQRIKNLRRQRMYTLRNLEKRGKQLMEQGVTSENLKSYLAEIEGLEDDGNNVN